MHRSQVRRVAVSLPPQVAQELIYIVFLHKSVRGADMLHWGVKIVTGIRLILIPACHTTRPGIPVDPKPAPFIQYSNVHVVARSRLPPYVPRISVYRAPGHLNTIPQVRNSAPIPPLYTETQHQCPATLCRHSREIQGILDDRQKTGALL